MQITAAAFAKGLLDLETSNNQLTPILASLVNKDAKLLDFVTHEVEEDILHAKQKLYNIMTEGHVKGRGPNKEYSTSDTAVFDDDFERSGPVGYLRRTSANAKALRVPSPKKAPHPGGPSVPQPGAADESAGGEAEEAEGWLWVVRADVRGPRARAEDGAQKPEQGGVLGDVLAARGDAQRDGVRRGGRKSAKARGRLCAVAAQDEIRRRPHRAQP